MPHTSVSEVREILNDSSLEEGFVGRMISSASIVVTNVFAGDTTVDSSFLKEIEKWFAAHMIASTPLARTVSEEKIGDAGVVYTGKWGENLKSTPYGQMVLTLDYTGKMTRMGKAEARIVAIKSEED